MTTGVHDHGGTPLDRFFSAWATTERTRFGYG
jgi:hypothetical protein